MKLLVRYICFIWVIWLVNIKPSSAQAEQDSSLQPGSLPFRMLSPVYCISSRVFKSAEEKATYNRLRDNVLIAWPYARYAGKRYRQLSFDLMQAKTQQARKELIKACEQEVKDKFNKELKNLTVTQGKILVKLLQRETGSTGYVLISEVKNKFSAFILQAVAKGSGHDLKQGYDPDLDAEIEQIVRLAEGSV